MYTSYIAYMYTWHTDGAVYEEDISQQHNLLYLL